ncbi:MAG: ferrochelatase [Parachlamydiaceae bacterium]|nr:ferrochelatase [Parachlamydiaceae bacterium]
MKTGVLLINLGTPDSPAPKDVKRYLIEFLTDGRVIDLPWLQRQVLVRGFIVPRRYKISAKAYKEIWTCEGGPLLMHGKRLKIALQKELGEVFEVELAMRYQNPSIEVGLNSLIQKGVSKVIILPLFPHYASATTGSVQQKVMEILSKRQIIPKVTFIDQYCDHPGLIDAFCASAKAHTISDYDHVLFSFHGLPERQLTKVDCNKHCLKSATCCEKIAANNKNCYAAQCYATANAIAKNLQLSKENYTISFQSRLGKEPWLQPYTAQTIIDFAKNKKEKILVFCPSFVCDCLETLYEINVEYTEDFKKAGGKQLTLVDGLNDSLTWVQGLRKIIHEA